MTYIDQVATAVRNRLSLDDRPGERAEELYRLYALLVLCKGTSTTLKDVHDAWSVWKLGEQADHPSLVPFGELSESMQAEDAPFLEAILSVAEELPAD